MRFSKRTRVEIAVKPSARSSNAASDIGTFADSPTFDFLIATDQMRPTGRRTRPPPTKIPIRRPGSNPSRPTRRSASIAGTLRRVACPHGSPLRTVFLAQDAQFRPRLQKYPPPPPNRRTNTIITISVVLSIVLSFL